MITEKGELILNMYKFKLSDGDYGDIITYKEMYKDLKYMLQMKVISISEHICCIPSGGNYITNFLIDNERIHIFSKHNFLYKIERLLKDINECIIFDDVLYSGETMMRIMNIRPDDVRYKIVIPYYVANKKLVFYDLKKKKATLCPEKSFYKVYHRDKGYIFDAYIHSTHKSILLPRDVKDYKDKYEFFDEKMNNINYEDMNRQLHRYIY